MVVTAVCAVAVVVPTHGRATTRVSAEVVNPFGIADYVNISYTDDALLAGTSINLREQTTTTNGKFIAIPNYGEYSGYAKSPDGNWGRFSMNLTGTNNKLADDWFSVNYFPDIDAFNDNENRMAAPGNFRLLWDTDMRWDWKPETVTAPTQKATFKVKFTGVGIYHIQIKTLRDGVATPDVADFKFLIRTHVPELRADWTREDGSVGMGATKRFIAKRVKESTEWYLTFRQVGGYRDAGMKMFLDGRAVADMTMGGAPLDAELDTSLDDSGRFIFKHTAGAPIELGMYEINFLVQHDDYDDIDANGELADNNTPFTVTAYISFEKTVGFPVWTLVAGIGALLLIAAAWYGIRVFAYAIETRHSLRAAHRAAATEK